MTKFYSVLDEMKLRGNDPTGHGYYGAKRGSRKHKGLDILSKPSDAVYTPIEGKVTKIGQVYSQTAIYKYVEISNKTYRIRLMYCFPLVSVGEEVAACDVIGQTQDIASFWGGDMSNHIHIEVYKNGLLTDPEPLFEVSD